MSERDDRSLEGLEYRIAFALYSKEGRRGAKVLEFLHGESFLLELECIDETWAERHSGRLVGPFASPTDAEHFIIATPWFNGEE